MARRYTGDIELRLSYKKYRGWNGKMGMFYFATVAAPGYRRRGILSPREVGIDLTKEDPQSAESYDRVAKEFLKMGEKADGVVRKYGSIENGTVSLLRVQQAPCPVAEKGRGRVARKGQGRDEPEFSPQNVWRYLRYDAEDRDGAVAFARASTLEVAERFHVSIEQAYKVLAGLAKKKLISRGERIGFRHAPQTFGNTKLGLMTWEITYEPETE